MFQSNNNNDGVEYKNIQPIDETLSDEQKQLQAQFMAVVEKMKIVSCPLPNQFQLFYKVTQHFDQCGKVIFLQPFITKKQAKDSGENNGPCEDEFENYVGSTILWNDNNITSDKNNNKNRPLHVLDIKTYHNY